MYGAAQERGVISTRERAVRQEVLNIISADIVRRGADHRFRQRRL